MGVLLGLMAAVGWGIADFLVARTSRRIGVLQALFYIQLAGLIAIIAVLLARFEVPHAPEWLWFTAFGLGVLNTLCIALLYRSYSIGTLAIVSPITSGFAVVTALLALVSGERPEPVALLGALLLVVGVGIVARSDANNEPQTLPSIKQPFLFLLPGVAEAITVAIGFGVYFWGLSFVTPSLGEIWPIVFSRVCSAVGVGLWMLGGNMAPGRLPRSLWLFVAGAAATDTVAFLSFTFGIRSADTAIVTALASLFSAITVLLAWALARERLAGYQWLGVGVILAGVLMVSV